jgi:hypothetical protein
MTARPSAHRHVIERALEWITRFRRLARRYDRIGAHFEAFARLACAVICYRRTVRTGVLLNNPKRDAVLAR